jgi:magnesium-transporting ATPase (P-type)
MKGKLIIAVFVIIWVCILTYITFFSHNPYINTAALFFGMMFTVCGFAYGCEELEKKQK